MDSGGRGGDGADGLESSSIDAELNELLDEGGGEVDGAAGELIIVIAALQDDFDCDLADVGASAQGEGDFGEGGQVIGAGLGVERWGDHEAVTAEACVRWAAGPAGVNLGRSRALGALVDAIVDAIVIRIRTSRH